MTTMNTELDAMHISDVVSPPYPIQPAEPLPAEVNVPALLDPPQDPPTDEDICAAKPHGHAPSSQTAHPGPLPVSFKQ